MRRKPHLSPQSPMDEKYGEFPEIASMFCRLVKLTCEGNKSCASVIIDRYYNLYCSQLGLYT